MSALLQTEELSLGYPGHLLFENLSIDVLESSILGVIGANGSGKTSFIKSVLGLIQPNAGRVTWRDKPPRTIGYLAQSGEFDRQFPIRVRDVVAMGAWSRFNLQTQLGEQYEERISKALELAGMSDHENRPIQTLSGGELQRTLFARVVMQDSRVILLDEPFNDVDQNTEKDLLCLINRWRNDGRAVILVLHDLSSVLDHCDHTLLLGNQRASHGPTKDILTKERLVDHGYLSAVQASWILRNQPTDTGLQIA